MKSCIKVMLVSVTVFAVHSVEAQEGKQQDKLKEKAPLTAPVQGENRKFLRNRHKALLAPVQEVEMNGEVASPDIKPVTEQSNIVAEPLNEVNEKEKKMTEKSHSLTDDEKMQMQMMNKGAQNETMLNDEKLKQNSAVQSGNKVKAKGKLKKSVSNKKIRSKKVLTKKSKVKSGVTPLK